MPPMPTVWWLRPLSSAARVGEHSAVVWNRLNFSPVAARRSAFGVAHGPPNALDAPKPASSISTTRTFGAPSGGRSSSIGANAVSVSLASYVTSPERGTSGTGSTSRRIERLSPVLMGAVFLRRGEVRVGGQTSDTYGVGASSDSDDAPRTPVADASLTMGRRRILHRQHAHVGGDSP